MDGAVIFQQRLKLDFAILYGPHFSGDILLYLKSYRIAICGFVSQVAQDNNNKNR